MQFGSKPKFGAGDIRRQYSRQPPLDALAGQEAS
jgi:hypothetical protein